MQYQTTVLDTNAWISGWHLVKSGALRDADEKRLLNQEYLRRLIDAHIQEHAAAGWQLVNMQEHKSGNDDCTVFIWRK